MFCPTLWAIEIFLQYRKVEQSGVDYSMCSADNSISCSSNSGFQYAGICPKKQSVSGLLYFGLAEKMPADCKWILALILIPRAWLKNGVKGTGGELETFRARCRGVDAWAGATTRNAYTR